MRQGMQGARAHRGRAEGQGFQQAKVHRDPGNTEGHGEQMDTWEGKGRFKGLKGTI